MFRLESGAKQLYLRAMLWGGVMLRSLCDDLLPAQMDAGLFVLEARPPLLTDTSIETSVATITTTVGYKPSPIPGEPWYTILGCYGPPSRDKGGRIFGVDERVMNSAKVQPGNLTIEGCLQECSSAMPLDKSSGHYTYAGLLNGEKCLCGLQLSADSQKLPAAECNIPCSGDQRLWCGGSNKIFIYGLTSGDDAQIQETRSTATPISTRTPTPSSTTSTERGTVTAQSANVGGETNSPHPAGSNSSSLGRHISVPTIAAISGGLTAAVLAAAGLFLCYRVHKRKKREPYDSVHVRSANKRSGRRSIPSPIILTGTTASASTEIFGLQQHYHHHTGKESGSGTGTGTGSSGSDDEEERYAPILDLNFTRDEEDKDLVPATPVLETGVGTGIPAGLHARRATLEGKQQQTPYNILARDVRPGPASPHAPDAEGASSAVQWRPNNSNDSYAVTVMVSPTWTLPATADAARGRAMSSSHIHMTPARFDDPSDRVWHRKLSTPYQPTTPEPPPSQQQQQQQQATEIGIAIGDPIGDAITANVAQRGPPSEPPTTLPAAPPMTSQVRAGSPLRSRAAMDRLLPGGDLGVRSEPHFFPPTRPRGSSDTTNIATTTTTTTAITKPSSPMPTDNSPAALRSAIANVPLAAPKPRAGGAGMIGPNARGEAHHHHHFGLSNPNASTPTLGRYGSITTKSRRPPRTESPVLGWRTSDGRNPWGASLREMKGLRDCGGAQDEAQNKPNDKEKEKGKGKKNSGKEKGKDGGKEKEKTKSSLDDGKRSVTTPPVLPPISPGEEFDHNRWKGTVYYSCSSPEESGDMGHRGMGLGRKGGTQEEEEGGGEASSESVSSVGTGILFSS